MKREISVMSSSSVLPSMDNVQLNSPSKLYNARDNATLQAYLKEEEDKWEAEMKALEEVDRWQALANANLPADLKDEFNSFLSNYSGLKVLPAQRMMKVLNWERTKLVQYLAVLKKLPLDLMPPCVDLLESFVADGLAALILLILFKLSDKHAVELVAHISRQDAHRLIQTARHLHGADIDIMVGIIDRMTIQELLDMFTHVDEPSAKECRLCKSKRLHRLEFRMLNEQVPEGLIKVPGTMPFYEGKTKVWTAADENNYEWNATLGQVLWMKRHPVDLIRICDNCLEEVFGFLSNQRRFEPVHHIDASVRLEAFRELRDHEKGMAEVIWQLDRDRHYRRAREFALKALKVQREGLKMEAAARAANAAEQQRQHELKLQRDTHYELVNNSLETDKKWIKADVQADRKDLQIRQEYTALKQHMGYDGVTTFAPRLRKHSLTWKLAPFDEQGNPISKEGAKRVFGDFVPQDYDDAEKLRYWKNEANARHQHYLSKKANEYAASRAVELNTIRELNLHVRLRNDALDDAQEYSRYVAAMREKFRLEKRAEDRIIRREKRFKQYLIDEGQHMMYEDNRSYQLRDYIWQCFQEQREREMMFNNEVEQREVDDFWGLDLFEQKRNDEEMRLRRYYDKRVAELNGLLVATNAVKKTKPASIQKIGTLREDVHYDAESRRRDAVIRKLKAEQIRGELKTRPLPGYLNEKWKPLRQRPNDKELHKSFSDISKKHS